MELFYIKQRIKELEERIVKYEDLYEKMRTEVLTVLKKFEGGTSIAKKIKEDTDNLQPLTRNKS